MNRAIVITRYALSLVKLVQETGHGAIVSSEANTLVHTIHQVPELQRTQTVHVSRRRAQDHCLPRGGAPAYC